MSNYTAVAKSEPATSTLREQHAGVGSRPVLAGSNGQRLVTVMPEYGIVGIEMLVGGGSTGRHRGKPGREREPVECAPT